MTSTKTVGRGPGQGHHAGRQVDQSEEQMTEDRAGGPAAEGPRGLQPRVHERVDREQDDQRENCDAWPGDGEDPTMTAKLPSSINEMDVDLNMTGIPFACLSRTA
jgi:hypothetical protein